MVLWCGLFFFSSILLTACSQNPSRQLTDQQKIITPWHIHEKLVQRITKYETRGTLSLFSDNHKLYVHFYWQQSSPHHYQLVFTNLFGITELQLIQDGTIVKFIHRKVKYVINEQRATYVIYQLTGMKISLENFRQWIMGLPGDCANFRLDEQNLLREVYWNAASRRCCILYIEYKKAFGLPYLPSSIEVHQDNQCIKVKID
ncbi:lipoprotein insertase outer membrane protein LolB [Candidatus Erwinia haradaeae]|uniref:lipoprotein insertase outer membrane protein LolB n=1 Tax=Candidatus Erwinia haradaeae TaxID=1922217 RepID=UPI001300AE10